MMKKAVSIVIVNYNGRELLKIILGSIKKSSFKSYETIIVDNNSDDGSQEFVRNNYKNIKLVENKENMGYSGINSALKYCNGKYILFLNNDMEIEKNCIKRLVGVLNDESIGMAAPKLVNYCNKNIISGGTWLSRAFYNGHIKGSKKLKSKVIPYLGAGMIRKNIVDTYGYLFDPDYFIYGEDVDLGLRIRLLRKKVLFVNNAIAYHMHATTTSKSKRYKMTFLLERNLLMTYFKILSVSNIILLMPYVFFMRLLAIIKDLATLKLMNVFARLYAILWIIFHFNMISRKRRTLQKLRKAEDSFLFKVFSEKYLSRKKFVV